METDTGEGYTMWRLLSIIEQLCPPEYKGEVGVVGAAVGGGRG